MRHIYTFKNLVNGKIMLVKQNILKEEEKNIFGVQTKDLREDYIGQLESMEKKIFYLK